MLKIEKFVTPSPEQWEIIIEGMRNPKNSWDRMDSFKECNFGPCDQCSEDDCHGPDEGVYAIGPNDHTLMMQLADGGPVHAKYRRMIDVFVTINAPLYWWKEFDTYKVGTVCNSCSTMHKIHAKGFTRKDFSFDQIVDVEREMDMCCLNEGGIIDDLLAVLNHARQEFLRTHDKKYWWQMIQLLPTSYNQKRTIKLNYEVLHNIYTWRRNHKLDEWKTLCSWIEELPYSELIIGEREEPANA